MGNQRLSTEVLAVLNRATIAENHLILPNGRLDRKLYESVNKALVLAGGKWNRSAQAYVFNSDPREKLRLALQTGIVIDEKKLYQAFYTTRELAEQLAKQADVEGMRVLEPSAGDGAIVEACLKFGARQVDCVEIREECRDKLIGHRRAVTIADFLNLKVYEQFDRVVMNPPFTNNQDVSHVEHALKFLKPGGKLVSVMYGNRDRAKLEKLLSRTIATTRDVDAGAFKESGTNIVTFVLEINVP